ncbi:sensor histidine kinase [Hymenobacter wooponensis]|uniref:histidine kinase n=1 Tax=Hymenobacter wooponensis TaxID=1525360 RepID=A0A4Z0MTS4_9BACT|nr:CHASE3 domain-containing protein [Hymenobacter wooponensis]TGD83024.1 PAS domain S-box protein [Hymenobacter wooponensis]
MKIPISLWRSSLSGYAVATLLLVGVALMTYRSLARLLDHEARVEHTHVVLVRLESVMSLLKDAETGQRGYLLTGEDAFLEPLRIAERRTAQEQRALDSLTADNWVQQRRLDTLQALVASNYALLQADLAAYQSHQRYNVADLRQSKALMDQLRGLVRRLQAEEEHLLVVRRQRSDDYARLTYPLILALTLFVAGLASWRLQRSQAAEHLSKLESSARFAQLLENLPHLAWTASPDGTFTYYNRQWADYTGASPEQLALEGVVPYMHPDDQLQARTAWRHSLETGEPTPDLRVRWRRGHDGEYRWHLARTVPLRSISGEIIMWMGTSTDIHAQQLQQQELERVNTDLDNFIYSASHDLKTPISNIEALLTALREELALPPQASDIPPLLNFMEGAVERFKRTISHMTEVVKLQKANSEPAISLVVADVVQEVCLDLERVISTTKAEINLDLAGCPTLNFAEKNLRSIVYNLLSNALKYRHPKRPPVVQVRCYRAGGYHVLSVQDNGLGLNLGLEQEQKLFGLFQRLHDHVEGSGVGLYMVKKIVTNNGGHLEVESQLGRGSVFRVYLP